MKMTSMQLKYTIAAILVACGLSALAGFPIISPDQATALGMLGMLGEVTIVEVKKTIDDLGTAWEQWKKTNDELIKAKAEGKAVSDLEAKLEKIGKDLDKFTEQKSALDAQILDIGRQLAGGAGGAKGATDLETELKSFNLMLRADFGAKGKPFPGDLDAATYTHYKSGFFKMARTGNLEALSADERKAMSAGSDPDGGYMLPTPTVGAVVKRMYEQTVMRQLATVQTISTQAIVGVVDNGDADAGWVSELGSRTDTTTPQVGQYRIDAHEMYAAPKASQTLIDDAAVDVESWMAGKIGDKFARVEGLAFWQGTGVGQPRGLAAYTTAATADATRTWGQFEHVVTGANGAFHTDKFDPIHTLMGTIKDHYLPNANWCMRRAVRTAARKIKEATTDRYMWEPSMQQAQPERFMGYPVRVDEYMPTLATGSLSLAFGDFRAAYLIVDRIGIRTLRDPFTSKPYVIFYSTKRTGGGAVDFEAVKFMKFST